MNPVIACFVIVFISDYSTFPIALNWWSLDGRARSRRWRGTIRRVAPAIGRSSGALKLTPVVPRPSHGQGILRRAAFTLVELLVVIGVIATVIAILLRSLSAARKSARHIQLCAGLREVMLGYTQYHIDNNGSLLFRYTPPTVNGTPITVDDPVSGFNFGLPVADRFPWRLAPKVGNIWAVMHIHAEVPPRPQAGDNSTEALLKAYTLSINPSFGINSVYVGGHAGPLFQGFAGPSGDSPNTGKHVAFKTSEVRRPSELIVFAECVARNAPFGDPDTGLHFVMPPRAGGQRWKVVNGEFQLTSSVITGIPKGRFGKRAVIGFFDGHVASMLPAELEDMRLWAPRATAADYDIP